MLKGFFDKVAKEEEGLSHVITKTGKRRTLTGIRKALKQIGVRKGTWTNLGSMPSTAAWRTASLDKCTTMHFTVRPADSSDPIVRKQLPEESRP